MIRKRTEKKISKIKLELMSDEIIKSYLSGYFKVGDIIDQTTAYNDAGEKKVEITSLSVNIRRKSDGSLDNIWVGHLGVWGNEKKILAKKTN